MDRNRLDRAAEDELDRQERATTAFEADESGWERALAVYEVASPLMAPVVSAMVNVFAMAVPRRKQKRRLDWLRQLDRAVSRLEGRLDLAMAGRETFEEIVEAVADRVDRREIEGKAEYYAAVLANGLTHEAPDSADQAAMLATLDGLRPLHLHIVAILRDGRIEPGELPQLNAIVPILERRIRGVSPDALEAHWHDLQTYNIVPWLAQPRRRHADPLDLKSQLTPFGERFARWITVQR